MLNDSIVENDNNTKKKKKKKRNVNNKNNENKRKLDKKSYEEKYELYEEQIEEILALHHIYFPLYVENIGHIKKEDLPNDLMSNEEFLKKSKELNSVIIVNINDEININNCLKFCIFFNFDNDFQKYKITFCCENKYPYSYPSVMININAKLNEEQINFINLNIKKICAKNYGRITLFDICIFINEYINKTFSNDFKNLWEEMKYRIDDSRSKRNEENKKIINSYDKKVSFNDYFKENQVDRENEENNTDKINIKNNNYKNMIEEEKYILNIYDFNSISGFSAINSSLLNENLEINKKQKNEKKMDTLEDKLNSKNLVNFSNKHNMIMCKDNNFKNFYVVKNIVINYYRNTFIVKHSIDTNVYIIHSYILLNIFHFLTFFLNHIIFCNRGFNLYCNILNDKKEGKKKKNKKNEQIFKEFLNDINNLNSSSKKKKKFLDYPSVNFFCSEYQFYANKNCIVSKKNEKSLYHILNELDHICLKKIIHHYRMIRKINIKKIICELAKLAKIQHKYLARYHFSWFEKEKIVNDEKHKERKIYKINEIMKKLILKRIFENNSNGDKNSCENYVKDECSYQKINIERIKEMKKKKKDGYDSDILDENEDICIDGIINCRADKDLSNNNNYNGNILYDPLSQLKKKNKNKDKKGDIKNLDATIKIDNSNKSDLLPIHNNNLQKEEIKIINEKKESTNYTIDKVVHEKYDCNKNMNIKKNILDLKNIKDNDINNNNLVYKKNIEYIKNILDKKENTKKILYIQCEYCKGQILEREIENNFFQNNKYLIWNIFRQILESISYLHKQKIYIKNLNTQNIYIDNDEYGVHIKIVNYSICNMIDYFYFYHYSYTNNSSYFTNFMKEQYDNNLEEAKEAEKKENCFVEVDTKKEENEENGENDEEDIGKDRKSSVFNNFRNDRKKKIIDNNMNEQTKEYKDFYIHSYNQYFYNCLNKKKYDYEELDLFSLGLVLYELWHIPFKTKEEKLLNIKNMIKEKTFSDDFINYIDNDAFRVLKYILISTINYETNENIGKLEYADILSLNIKIDENENKNDLKKNKKRNERESLINYYCMKNENIEKDHYIDENEKNNKVINNANLINLNLKKEINLNRNNINEYEEDDLLYFNDSFRLDPNYKDKQNIKSFNKIGSEIYLEKKEDIKLLLKNSIESESGNFSERKIIECVTTNNYLGNLKKSSNTFKKENIDKLKIGSYSSSDDNISNVINNNENDSRNKNSNNNKKNINQNENNYNNTGDNNNINHIRNTSNNNNNYIYQNDILNNNENENSNNDNINYGDSGNNNNNIKVYPNDIDIDNNNDNENNNNFHLRFNDIGNNNNNNNVEISNNSEDSINSNDNNNDNENHINDNDNNNNDENNINNVKNNINSDERNSNSFSNNINHIYGNNNNNNNENNISITENSISDNVNNNNGNNNNNNFSNNNNDCNNNNNNSNNNNFTNNNNNNNHSNNNYNYYNISNSNIIHNNRIRKITAEGLLNYPLIPIVIQRDLFKYFLQKLKNNSSIESSNVLNILLYSNKCKHLPFEENNNTYHYVHESAYEYDVINSYIFEYFNWNLSKKLSNFNQPLVFQLVTEKKNFFYDIKNSMQKIQNKSADRINQKKKRIAKENNNNYEYNEDDNYEKLKIQKKTYDEFIENLSKSGIQKKKNEKNINNSPENFHRKNSGKLKFAKNIYNNKKNSSRKVNNNNDNRNEQEYPLSEKKGIHKEDNLHINLQENVFNSTLSKINKKNSLVLNETNELNTHSLFENNILLESGNRNDEEKKCIIGGRFNQRIVFIDKNNKLLYVPFYLTEVYLNLIPHYTFNRSFTSSFSFFQNYFFENNKQKTIKRENSIIYNNIITVDNKKDIFNANSNNTDINISFCIYQLIILYNVIDILLKFEHYLSTLIIRWTFTDFLLCLVKDMLSLDCNKAYFIYNHFREGNISYKNLKKLLHFLDISYDEKILKILYSVIYDEKDHINSKMKKVSKMYELKNHKNKKFMNYIIACIVYLNNLFHYFNDSNQIFVWDFFMNNYHHLFGFSFAFNIYSQKNQKLLLSFGGVSTDIFSNSERTPTKATYNIIFEIFIDTISNIIFQELNKNNYSNMLIDFHSPSVVITIKAYKLLVYAFSLYNNLIQNGIKCECRITPLVETSKFENSLLKYKNINIHVQINQKMNSNPSLNIIDYENSTENPSSNIINNEENLNIVYNTHMIRVNIKKNFENESSLINYIKQFYSKK
ncbi:protein kinase, putative [Plasmodium relictum]|uniref:Protein kinase, putative n=1 Tax=Plasmodium relictum TaxID=85471 RepID=A0A1J1HD69_PLARL|nr:protein kinase, putative [Plasmodium relictum]CRH03868.1 protein kinase, putative [Plasmodium relictum]